MRRGPRSLTLVEQYLEARHRFRGVKLLRGGITLPLRPTPLSSTYTIRIDYKPTEPPRVFVVEPQLVGKPPHRYYSDGGRLCLYWHDYHNSMGFGESIVPWTAEWLYFYELWQVHGKWLAPESPHGQPK